MVSRRPRPPRAHSNLASRGLRWSPVPVPRCQHKRHGSPPVPVPIKPWHQFQYQGTSIGRRGQASKTGAAGADTAAPGRESPSNRRGRQAGRQAGAVRQARAAGAAGAARATGAAGAAGAAGVAVANDTTWAGAAVPGRERPGNRRGRRQAGRRGQASKSSGSSGSSGKVRDSLEIPVRLP